MSAFATLKLKDQNGTVVLNGSESLEPGLAERSGASVLRSSERAAPLVQASGKRAGTLHTFPGGGVCFAWSGLPPRVPDC